MPDEDRSHAGAPPEEASSEEASPARDPSSRRPPVSRLLLAVYNVVFFVGFLFYLPIFLWRMLGDRSYRHGLLERTGRVDRSGSDARVLWIHGVSVGEVKAAEPLVRRIKQAAPSLEIVISATTPTGRKVARDLFPDDRVIFYPLDFAHFPARSLRRIRPSAVLLMELELWPNFLHAAERRDIPVVVVNGRISERSYRGYRRVSWLLPQIDRIDLFAVQNATYGERLRALGVAPERIRVAGNMKYDRFASTLSEGSIEANADLAELLSCEGEQCVVVGGSTHAGEEEQLGRALLEVERALGRSLRLIVAPRHPERSSSVTEDLRSLLEGEAGARPVQRLTELRRAGVAADPGSWIVIDTIGELEKTYSLADVVFVGGSLIKHGGQNMLEPVALGKPTIVGPHVQNFADDVRNLLEARALVRVSNADELAREVERLIRDPDRAALLVQGGFEVLAAGRGATQRTFEHVKRLLEDYGVDALAPRSNGGGPRSQAS